MAATYSSLVGLVVGDKYEVRRVLGAGGMGVVCEAIHLDLGKKVAIKLIDKSLKESELIVARFRREARALGQIQSEHIVDVFDVGVDHRLGLYMVMEHLPGEDLQTRLERDGRLDLTAGVTVAHQMARGLEKAHAAGIIHRDLKPANVFLTKRDDGSLLVKLLDFGVSKVLDEAGSARITGSGAPIGTPLYMSPEQAEGRDDTDGRADIWALGAVLYEALSGAPPIADRGGYHATIVAIMTARPKPLHESAPWVPAPLAKVIDEMLVHDRDARIKDATSVTRRLLEAYPMVLPDGTGRHTAVITMPTALPVDATGDTEVFTSAGMSELARESGSSAKLAALPATPPEMEPVALMEVAPDTQRDERLAVRAERRRLVRLGFVIALIAVVGAGAYLAGRRSGPPPRMVLEPEGPALTMPVSTSSSAAATPPAPAVSAAPTLAAVTPDSLPSASPVTASPPRTRRRSPPRGAAPAAADLSAKGPGEAPAQPATEPGEGAPVSE